MCQGKYGTATAETFNQDAEKVFQLRSHLESILNVPERVRLRCFLRLGPR